MSRPYPNPSEFAQSPLGRQGTGNLADPSSPAGGAAPSFKTNVNRQKTKRWVEAKSFSYDGDDWGEADEYDEYGAHEQPATAPVPPKPTGLRQRGQSAESSPAAPAGSGMPPASIPRPTEAPRRDFGPVDSGQASPASNVPSATPVPSGHPQGAQQPPSRYSDTSVAAHNQAAVAQNAQQPSRHSPGLHQHPSQASAGPPQLHLQTQGSNLQQQHYKPYSPAEHTAQTVPNPQSARVPSSTQSFESNTPSDVEKRRDFSPSALPAPLTSNPAPAAPAAREASPGKHQPSGVKASNPPSTDARARTESNPQKALPFIRPADIYKRMAEERERERTSLDSSRPSIDSNQSGRPTEGELAVPGGSARSQKSSESLNRSARRSPGAEGASDDGNVSGYSRSPLDPVKERTTEYVEYGFDPGATSASSQSRAGPVAATDSRQTPGGYNPDGSPSLLPNLNRLSGFGDSLWPATIQEEPPQHPEPAQQTAPAPTHAPIPQAPAPKSGQPSSQDRADGSAGALSHQPSTGLRSVVNQAFDKPAVSSSSATPASSARGSQRSQANSGPNRSDSASTSGISPIMAGEPSRYQGTPAIAEEQPNESLKESSAARPMSQETVVPRSQPTTSSPVTRAPTHDAGETLPSQAFIPGHRRDMSAPSPNNSPARTPAVEATAETPSAEEAELAMLTPTDTTQSTSSIDRRVNPIFTGVAGDLPNAGYPPREEITSAPRSVPSEHAGRSGSPVTSAKSALMHRATSSTSSSPRTDDLRSGSPTPGTPSPTRVKVKSIADQFEAARSRSSSTQSLQRAAEVAQMIPVGKVQEELKPYRPTPGREQSEASFRPALPGGWVSYATTNAGPASEAASGQATPAALAPEQEVRRPSVDPTTGRTLTATERLNRLLEEEQAAIAPSESEPAVEHPPPATEPTAAAVHEPRQPPSVVQKTSTSDLPSPASPELLSVIPEGRSGAGDRSISAGSSAPPTPPPKDTPRMAQGAGATDYFGPPPVPLKGKSGNRTSGANQLPALHRPDLQPNLSTEASPQDQESDRLRKEIVKTLSPVTPNFSKEQLDASARPISADSRMVGPDGKSLVPSEYESYWAAQRPEGEASPSAASPLPPKKDASAQPQNTLAVPASGGRQPRQLQDVVQAPPANPAQGTNDNMLRVDAGNRPGLLQQRFSWEQGSETHIPTLGGGPAGGLGTSLPPHASQPDSHGPVELSSDSHRGPSSDEMSGVPAQPVITGPGVESHGRHGSDAPMIDGPAEQSTIRAVSAEPGPATENPQRLPEHHTFEDGLYPLEEGMSADNFRRPETNEPGNASGYQGPADRSGPTAEKSQVDGQGDIPGTPTDVKSQHVRARSSSLLNRAGQPPPPPEIEPNFRASNQPKSPAFREVLALKTSGERIGAFKSSRDQLAIAHSGLGQWIALTASQDPDVATNSQGQPILATTGLVGAGGQLQSPAGSSTTKPSPVGAPPTQPYYQQYLNFSTSPGGHQTVGGAPPHSLPPTAGGSGDNAQTFSPSGLTSTRKSRSQVEARGKDLLHTAGLFSGKANVAAKGLFAKGKSRFRVSGGEKGIPVDNTMDERGGDYRKEDGSHPNPVTTGASTRRLKEEEEWSASPYLPGEGSRPSSLVAPEQIALPASPAPEEPPATSQPEWRTALMPGSFDADDVERFDEVEDPRESQNSPSPDLDLPQMADRPSPVVVRQLRNPSNLQSIEEVSSASGSDGVSAMDTRDDEVSLADQEEAESHFRYARARAETGTVSPMESGFDMAAIGMSQRAAKSVADIGKHTGGDDAGEEVRREAEAVSMDAPSAEDVEEFAMRHREMYDPDRQTTGVDDDKKGDVEPAEHDGEHAKGVQAKSDSETMEQLDKRQLGDHDIQTSASEPWDHQEQYSLTPKMPSPDLNTLAYLVDPTYSFGGDTKDTEQAARGQDAEERSVDADVEHPPADVERPALKSHSHSDFKNPRTPPPVPSEPVPQRPIQVAEVDLAPAPSRPTMGENRESDAASNVERTGPQILAQDEDLYGGESYHDGEAVARPKSAEAPETPPRHPRHSLEFYNVSPLRPEERSTPDVTRRSAHLSTPQGDGLHDRFLATIKSPESLNQEASPKPPSVQSVASQWPLDRRFQDPTPDGSPANVRPDSWQHPALRSEGAAGGTDQSHYGSSPSKFLPPAMQSPQMMPPQMQATDYQPEATAPQQAEPTAVRSRNQRTVGLFKNISHAGAQSKAEKRFSSPLGGNVSSATNGGLTGKDLDRRQSMSTLDSAGERKRSSPAGLHQSQSPPLFEEVNARPTEGDPVAQQTIRQQSPPVEREISPEVPRKNSIPAPDEKPLPQRLPTVPPQQQTYPSRMSTQPLVVGSGKADPRKLQKEKRPALGSVGEGATKKRLSSLGSFFGRSHRLSKAPSPQPPQAKQRPDQIPLPASREELNQFSDPRATGTRQQRIESPVQEQLRREGPMEYTTPSPPQLPPPEYSQSLATTADPLRGYYAPKKPAKGLYGLGTRDSLDNRRHPASAQPAASAAQDVATPLVSVVQPPVNRQASKHGVWAPQPRRPIIPTIPSFPPQGRKRQVIEPQYETPPIPAPYRRVSGESGFIPPAIQSPPNIYWGEAAPRSGYFQQPPQQQRSATMYQTGSSGYFGIPPQTSREAQQQQPQPADRSAMTRRYSHSSATPPQTSHARTPPGFPLGADGQRLPLNTPVEPQQRPWSISPAHGSGHVSATGDQSEATQSRPPLQPARRSKSVQWASPRPSPDAGSDQPPHPSRTPPSRGALRTTPTRDLPLDVINKPLPAPPPPSKSPKNTNPLMPSLPPSPVVKQGAVLEAEEARPPFRRPPSPALTPPPGEPGVPSPAVNTEGRVTSVPDIPTAMGMGTVASAEGEAKDVERVKERDRRERDSLISSEKETVDLDDDEVVMSSTAYPGEMWAPAGLEGYFDEEAVV